MDGDKEPNPVPSSEEEGGSDEEGVEVPASPPAESTWPSAAPAGSRRVSFLPEKLSRHEEVKEEEEEAGDDPPADSGFTSGRAGVLHDLRETAGEPTLPRHNQSSPDMSSSRVLRSERRLNVDTGTYATRECRVELVTGLTEPMDPAERRRREFFTRGQSNKLFGSFFKTSSKGNLQDGGGDGPELGIQQYRLETKKSGRDTESTLLAGMDLYNGRLSTKLLNDYVHWTFQSSFGAVLLSLSVIFLLLVTLWAVLLYVIAQFRPQCLYVGSLHFDEAGNFFIDAFAISWTTFSTVGYGLTGPNTSNERAVDHCMGMNAIASVEAFFGVLFAGFAGAIIFGKVTRVQSIARVAWSSPMVIRYGQGVNVEERRSSHVQILPPADGVIPDLKRDDDSSSSDDDETKLSHLPCPVLEFRVINQLYDQVGGELINSSISVWASTLAETAPPSVLAAANLNSGHKYKFTNPLAQVQKGMQKGTNVASRATNKVFKAAKRMSTMGKKPAPAPKQSENSSSIRSDTSDSILFGENYTPGNPMDMQAVVAAAVDADRRNLMNRAQSMMTSKKHVVMQEDPTCKLTPQLIYSKLDIETDSHPFFKRVWIVRHKLDENSPLLSHEAQTAIKNNGGFWPREWNNYQDVRHHVHFNEIMVSLSGTANVSGNTVYSQKVYDYVDMNVGWRFAETLVRHPKTKNLSVDISLINDVLEQHGGGGEPFTDLIDVGDRDVVEASFGKPPTNIYAQDDNDGTGDLLGDIEDQRKEK